jgi:hypothetical protein
MVVTYISDLSLTDNTCCLVVLSHLLYRFSSSICCLDSIAQAQGTRSCLDSHVIS